MSDLTVSPAIARYWRRLRARFHWAARLDECAQDPRYHAEGDAGLHTRLVVQAMREDPEWQAADAGTRRLLLGAALLHDVGKPDTTRVESDGSITARGHPRRGAIIARNVLWELGVPFAERERLVGLVRWHMRPPFLAESADARRDVFRVSQTARCDHLALLSRADVRGRVAPDRERMLEAVAFFREFADEQGCLGGPRSFASGLSRYEYFARSDRDPDYAAYDDTWGEVVLMAGLPGSGKNYYLAREHRELPVVSLDDLRVELGMAPGATGGALHATATERAKELLRARRPFAWNATSLLRDLRGAFVSLCRRYGASVRIVYVEADAAAQRARNESREGAVPLDRLQRMLDRWDVPDPTEAPAVDYVIGGQRLTSAHVFGASPAPVAPTFGR